MNKITNIKDLDKLINKYIKATCNSTNTSRSAERLNGIAKIIKALNIDGSQVDQICIDWRAIEHELLPTLNLKLINDKKENDI